MIKAIYFAKAIVMLKIGVKYAFDILPLNNKEEHLFNPAPMVPFYILILLIGGSIVLTLTYVSWRKYRGFNKNKRSVKRKSNR